MKDEKTHVVHPRQDIRNLQYQKRGNVEKLSALSPSVCNLRSIRRNIPQRRFRQGSRIRESISGTVRARLQHVRTRRRCTITRDVEIEAERGRAGMGCVGWEKSLFVALA